VAEAWNGTSWSIQKTPNPKGATYSQLSGVSCTAARACTAVGYSSGVGGALAEAWNGTSWSIQPTPNPSGAPFSVLSGVSCTAAKACAAVGFYENGSGVEVTLAEVWNGTSWSIQTTPNPSGATDSQLYGVSCTAASACTAVGFYVNIAGTFLTLAEAWNGTSWSIQTTPTPSGATSSGLSGVSCTAASACTAVGDSSDSSNVEVTLAEAWNGTAWSIQTTPTPSGATSSQFSGVSCTAASACNAVGSYDDSSGVGVTLVEVWNGTSWSIQTTPNTSGATSSGLSGVSCNAASACTAVGAYALTSGEPFTLAEAWNGTSWSIQTTPNPSSAPGSSLSGVSCTAASACTAVGEGNNGSGVYQTLAEAES
jgi:hypothetical protein